jgi:surface protein
MDAHQKQSPFAEKQSSRTTGIVERLSHNEHDVALNTNDQTDVPATTMAAPVLATSAVAYNTGRLSESSDMPPKAHSTISDMMKHAKVDQVFLDDNMDAKPAAASVSTTGATAATKSLKGSIPGDKMSYEEQISMAVSLKTRWNVAAESEATVICTSASVAAASVASPMEAEVAGNSLEYSGAGKPSEPSMGAETVTDKDKTDLEAIDCIRSDNQVPASKDEVPMAQAVDEDAEILRIEEELTNAREEGRRAALQPVDFVQAVVVEPKDQEIEQASAKKRLAAGCVLGVAALAVVVVSVMLFGGDDTSSPTTKPPIDEIIDLNRTDFPLVKYRCFENSTVLESVLDEYLGARDGNFMIPDFGPIKDWCVSKIQNFDYLFSTDRNINASTFDGSLLRWDVSNATSMKYMFAGAKSFVGTGLSAWNVANVVSLEGMFQDAISFNEDISKWNVSKVVTTASMFDGAIAFRGLGLDLWRLSECVDLSRMFRGASAFDANLVDWDVSSAVRMDYMFSDATSFVGHGLETWDVSNVQNMTGMFKGIGSLFDVDVTLWDVSSVVYMSRMFDGATGFRGLGLSSWNVSQAQDLSYMFSGASLMNADLSSWDLRSATTLEQMFFSAKSFKQNLCSWGSRLSPSVNTAYMFYETSCPYSRSPTLTSTPAGPFCLIC